jgi:hypothetical protein
VQKKLRNFISDHKGLSSKLVALVVIAIAIIAVVGVYIYTSGLLSNNNGSNATENLSIASIQGYTNGTIVVVAQSTGGTVVQIDNVKIENTGSGQVVGTSTDVTYDPSGGIISSLNTVIITADSGVMSEGTRFTVTLVTKVGGTFVCPSFIAMA